MSQSILSVEEATLYYRVYHRAPQSLKRAALNTLLGRGRGAPEDFLALDGVSFDLRRGEVLGVCGHNGSGKSTLLRLLAGTLQLSRGRIVLRGKIGAILSLAGGFHPDITGRENIYLNGLLMGFSPEEIGAKTPTIVEFADIGGFIDSPVRTYSSGMAARLGFSIAAHLDSDILLIDELFSVGDAGFQKKCQDWMAAQRERGKSMVLVSHDMQFLIHNSDRLLWLDHGKVRELGDPSAVGYRYIEWVLGMAPTWLLPTPPDEAAPAPDEQAGEDAP